MGQQDYDKYEDRLMDEFDLCGCSEFDPVINTIRGLLSWMDTDGDKRPAYYTLFNGNIGVYYLLVSLLDSKGCSEHGSSIRHPWLTEKGQELLEFLRHADSEEGE